MDGPNAPSQDLSLDLEAAVKLGDFEEIERVLIRLRRASGDLGQADTQAFAAAD